MFRSLDALWGTRRRRGNGLPVTTWRSRRALRTCCAQSREWSVSSRTWTPRAVASEAASLRQDVWRCGRRRSMWSRRNGPCRHPRRATCAGADPRRTENLAVPDGAARLHYLLFTPFRYAPPPGGRAFADPTITGVFYAADAVRTACAELGYWRWRHLLDVPALQFDAARSRRRSSGSKACHGRCGPARAAVRAAIATCGRTVTITPGTQRFGVAARGGRHRRDPL